MDDEIQVHVNPMLIINSIVMPAPSKFNIIYNDLESEESGRSIDGNMHRDVVAQNIRTIEVEWATMKKDDLKKFLTATSSENKYFTVIYYDPIMETRIKKTMYTESRKVDMYDFTMGEDGHPLWLNITASFIQVYNNDKEPDKEYTE